MKFKKKEDKTLTFKKVDDPRLLGSAKEKARSQYSQMSNFIPEITKEPTAFEKFTSNKFVQPIAQNYANLGSALTSGMGNVNVGVANTLRTLNAPVSFAASKLDELVTGKKVAPMSDPISKGLTSIVEKQEQATAPYAQNIADIQDPSKYVYGAVQSLPQLLPALTGAGQLASLGSIGTSAFGTGAREAEKAGASLPQQFLAGGASAGIEVGTEALPLQNLLKFTKGQGTVKDIVKNSLEELFGEAIAEASSPVIENIYTNDAVKEAYTTNLMQTSKQILDAGITGAVASVLIGGSALGVNIDKAVQDPTPENVAEVKQQVEKIIAPSFGDVQQGQPSAEDLYTQSIGQDVEYNADKAIQERIAEQQPTDMASMLASAEVNPNFKPLKFKKAEVIKTTIETEQDLADISTKESQPITIPYRKNLEPAPKMDGFGQDIEPSGNYINFHATNAPKGMPNTDYGEITFNKPKYVEYISTGENGWKKFLSEEYNGLTGQELSNAIANDGYDAIVTVEDGKYINEIVDLTSKKAEVVEDVATEASYLDEQGLEDFLNQKGYSQEKIWQGLDNNDSLIAINKGVNQDGTVTLYHRTDQNSANEIVNTQSMVGKEDGIFFTTKKDGQAEGFGDVIVEVDVPIEDLMLDDEFDDELHFRVPTRKIGDSIEVKARLDTTTQPTQETTTIEPQQAEKPIPSLPIQETVKPKLDVAKPVTPKPITMAESVVPSPMVLPASMEMREGIRKTLPSIQDSQMVSDEAKATMNEADFTYDTITNEETLMKARENLGTVEDFMRKTILKDATDTARGIELMRLSAKDGDFKTFNDIALKQAELMTKAGQTVQAQAMLRKMTPEGYLQYIAKEVDKQNKTGKQRKGQEDINELQKAIDNATPEQLEKIKKILEKRKIKYDELTPENINEYIEQIKYQAKVIDMTEEEMQFIYDKIVESLSLEGRQRDVAVAEAYKILEDKIPPSSTDTVAALQRISMLLNARTQARNITGNALMQMAEISKEAIGIPIDILTSKITGERTISPYDKTDLAKGLKGAKQGFADAWEDYQKGINTRRDSGQFEISNKKSFPTNTKYKALNSINKGLNKANDLTSFLLSAGDRPFFEATYEMEKSRLERLPQYKGKTDAIEAKAIEVAEERTFQNKSKLAQSAVDIRGKAGLFGRLVLPYAYTPANITDKVFDYSPLGSVRTISKNLVSDIKKGEFNQREFTDRLSRNLTGSAILLLGYTLAKNGVITGSYSDDKDEREFQKSIGVQDYAFNVGEYQVNFDWAQPIAVPLATGANLYQAGLSETSAKENIFNKLGQVSLESTKTLLEQPLLRGVQDLFGGYGSEGIITNVANIARTAPLQVVPGLSLMRQTRQTVDPKIRNVDYNSLFDQLRNQLPGLSQTLPYKYSTLGEKQEYSGGIGAKFLSPATTTKIEPSKLEQEILDVFQAEGNKDVFPKKAPSYFTKNKVRYDLTLREQSEFQEVMGTYVKESLEKLIATDNYTKLTPDKKSALISAIIADSYDYAKADYLSDK